jgi:hypothetical protein
MKFIKENLEDSQLIEFYKQLMLPRLIEEKMLILLRQGKISKWFSGMGQEAISVGATLAMQDDEFILPMHRNLGVFSTRKLPLYRLFCQFQGKEDGFTKGRDRSFHFGTKDTVMSVADKLKKEGRVKSGDSVYLYSVNLNIQNPLHLEENRLGSWAISDIIITMFEGPKGDGEALPIFTKEQVDDYYEDVVTTPSGENLKDMFMMPHEEEAKEFLSWFYSLGYDSIKYENKFEAAGESMLVFNPNQIKILNVEEYEVP